MNANKYRGEAAPLPFNQRKEDQPILQNRGCSTDIEIEEPFLMHGIPLRHVYYLQGSNRYYIGTLDASDVVFRMKPEGGKDFVGGGPQWERFYRAKNLNSYMVDLQSIRDEIDAWGTTDNWAQWFKEHHNKNLEWTRNARGGVLEGMYKIDFFSEGTRVKSKSKAVIAEGAVMQASQALTFYRAAYCAAAQRPMARFQKQPSDIALGMEKVNGKDSLKTFSRRVNAPSAEKWKDLGFHNAPPNRFDMAFEQSMNTVVQRGGRVRFNLDGLDIAKALRDTEALRMDGYTAWELRQIIGKTKWLNRTDFYLDGAKLSIEQLKSLGIMK